MSAYPYGSEKTKLKVWLAPEPDAGATETFVGVTAVTVQIPRACQGVSVLETFCTCM